MKIKSTIFIALFSLLFCDISNAQDTTFIQTLTFDSTGRDYVFQFPIDTGQSYERIIMQYRMRCKNGLISTSSDRNKGCGEWDYSCNTYITDSAYTDSIKANHPSHVISGFSGTDFYYTTVPTYTYTQYTQKQVTNDSVISETVGTVGTGTDMLNHPFGTTKQYSKVQYLWTAAELSSASITAGDINGIRLEIDNAADDADYLRIRMKHSGQDSLDCKNPDTTAFTEVYFLNTSFSTGTNEFIFYNAFNWDGASNIIVELSYSNKTAGTNNIINGHDAGFPACLINYGNDFSMDFSGAGYVDIGASTLSSVNDEITISLWCYGNEDVLPVNTSIFEGADGSGRRQVNSHLPWSNSTVYWDCGNDGNYDRIEKAANASDFEGKWNHWAFTKNATTGSMKIYLNGTLWHSGTGKTKQIDLTTLRFGANRNAGNKYFGKIDEFRVWNTELSLAEVSDWMLKEIDPSHPKYANLIAYYTLNEGTGTVVNDASTAALTGQLHGIASWSNTNGIDIFKGFSESNMRPNLSFVQGVYNQTITDIVFQDSIQNTPSLVNTYHIVSNSLEVLDTNYYYPSGNTYVYDDVTGTIIDTVIVSPQDTISISTLDYHAKSPSKFEIMSFVTPYGINLDLGLGGVMWAFDVTDFKPILHGAKRLQMTRGGQNQEEMDISFLFIEGTPPRDVKNIQQIWRVDSRSYTQINANDYFEPRTITLDSTASMFKIRSAITGHGQQGEFIQRNHFVNIDGGTPEFSWNVWKECADNEIFPQGGTWVFDRAGWCPGKATDLEEWSLDAYTPGQTINVDYGISFASGASNYIVNHQLVSYGPANFALDARIVDVIKPSNKTEYLRDNPICHPPVVIIQNTGSTTLTALTITYNIIGGTIETYTWQGSLDFLETEDVELPIPSIAFWNTSAGVNEFEVTISNPNGGLDSYANNNYLKVPFTKPPIHDKPIVLVYRTNLVPFQNSYTVKDISGTTVASGNGFASNTIYRDTLFLTKGCYFLQWNDSGNDGIDWWYNNGSVPQVPSVGSGYVFLEEIGGATKIFDPDYGAFIKYNFVMDANIGIDELNPAYHLNISPNPNSGEFTINYKLPANESGILQIYDVTGREVYKMKLEKFSTSQFLDIDNLENGFYNCIISSKDLSLSKKMIIVENN